MYAPQRVRFRLGAALPSCYSASSGQPLPLGDVQLEVAGSGLLHGGGGSGTVSSGGGSGSNRSSSSSLLEWVSEEFVVDNTDQLQRFPIPPTLAPGGCLAVELLGRRQRQAADGEYYSECAAFRRAVHAVPAALCPPRPLYPRCSVSASGTMVQLRGCAPSRVTCSAVLQSRAHHLLLFDQCCPPRPAPPHPACAACISYVRVVGTPLNDFMLQPQPQTRSYPILPASCLGVGRAEGSDVAAATAALQEQQQQQQQSRAAGGSNGQLQLVVLSPDPLAQAGGLHDSSREEEDGQEDDSDSDYDEEWGSGSESGGEEGGGGGLPPPPLPSAGGEGTN